MSKYIRIVLALCLLAVFAGCSKDAIKYNDIKITWNQTSKKVPNLYIRRIVEGDHTGNFYKTYGIDTIYTPKNDTWLLPRHISLFKEIPTTKQDHLRKALMIHENTHCMFDRWYFPTPPLKRVKWHTEQYGYASQIRYLILNDIRFSVIDKAKFIAYITDKNYEGMASLGEATYFVNYIVREARKEKKELDS